MAEINVERKARSPLPWILGLLLLAILAFFLWRSMDDDDTADRDDPVVVDSVGR